MKYTFEFISNYDGVSDYRLYINGKPGPRFCVNLDRECFYTDGSPALKDEVEAFNADRMKNHATAVAKFGADAIGQFIEYKPSGSKVAA